MEWLYFQVFNSSFYEIKAPLVFEAQKEHTTCFSEVRILRGKISNIFSFQTMKVRFSNICQVKIERGTQFGRVLIAITFISTDLPLAAKEWNWISQMSFSKNELIPIYLKARQNEYCIFCRAFQTHKCWISVLKIFSKKTLWNFP